MKLPSGLVALAVLPALLATSACTTRGASDVRPRAELPEPSGVVTGQVTSVTVSGYGKNSAEIVFVILNAQTGENQAFHILAYPAYERQVFAATAAVLSIAYTQRQPVRVSYLRLQNETDRALSVALDQAIPRNRRR